jgi:hypothetical protein
MVISTIKAIEGAIVGLTTAATNLVSSWKKGSRVTIAESCFEITGGVVAYSYYSGKFFDVLFTIENLFSTNIPFLLHIALIPLKTFLGCAGVVTNTFRAAHQSLCLYRQHKFLKIFDDHAWKGSDTRNVLAGTIDHFDEPGFQENLPLKFKKIITGKKEKLVSLLNKVDSGDEKAIAKAEKIFALWKGRHIRDKLAAITKLPDIELERALPLWLNNDIANLGGKEFYLGNLLKKVDKGDRKAIAEATKLLDTMQSYAKEKGSLHILKIAGGIIGALACIGFFMAIPIPATLFFLALVGLFGLAAYMQNTGVVENRDGGFSWKLCFHVEDIKNVVAEIKNYPDQIRAWINEKKPKAVTPHPFFERRVEIARKMATQIQQPAEVRRTRRATQDILSRTSKVA